MSVITSLTLENLEGSAGRITSIGQVFKQGDIPVGSGLQASFAGATVPIQMDIKATWPDGSVKHAIVSFENPAMASGGTLTLEHAETLTAAPIDVSTMATAQGYDFEIDIDGETVAVADLLATGSPWLSGALASEVRVTGTLTNGLEVRVDVRATADGEFETSGIVGNDNVETTGLEAKTYSVEIRQNGEALYANPALTQPHFTVWREKFSTETSDNSAHAVYDLAYLRQTGLMPSVDETIPLFDSTAYSDLLDHSDATFDPLELGGVHNIGGIDPDRGRSGESASYGLITDDQHSYLVTQSAAAREAMLELTDQYGVFSNYYRNPETGEAYFLEDTTSNSYSIGVGKDVAGTGGVIALRNDGPALRNAFSHKPSEYYLSYLITGDRYYADGLAHEGGSALQLWSNAVYLTADGHVDFASQLREQAWVLRDLFYAASLAPDGSRAAEVLTARLDGALQDYVDYYVNRDTPIFNEWGTELSGERDGAWFVGGDLEGALQSYNGTAIDRPYWQDWFMMVVGQIAATGHENAIKLGTWMAGFGAERFLQDDFDPYHNLYSILDYPNSGGSINLAFDATWERLNNAATSVGAVGPDVNQWEDFTFYAASAWGGAAAGLSGTRDARYAEALLWMTTALTDTYVETVFHQGGIPQFGVPVTFADYTIAGVQERTLGTEQADTILDGSGNRLIHAGDGNDHIQTGEGSHLVEGGDGDDALVGGNGEDWLFGGSGADLIAGGAGINYLQGDRHDNDFGRFDDRFYFSGNLGTTTIGDFEAGSDSLVFQASEGLSSASEILARIEDSDTGASLDRGDDGTLILTGVNAADLSETDIAVYDEILIGTSANDRLVSGLGDDLIHGGDGHDTLRGARGADRLDGGAGIDLIQYSRSNAGVTVDLTADVMGMQVAHGGDAEGDIVRNIERVAGSNHADTLTGDEGANALVGHGGDDMLSGGTGNDRLRGDAGADTLDGGDGLDWLHYGRSDEAVTIDLSTNEASGGHAEGDIISGFERVIGSESADTLIGDSGNNIFVGRRGDDTIFGGAGRDKITGGEGADVLDGGAGIDWVSYTDSSAGVAVDLTQDALGMQSASGGSAEGDVLSGFERILGSRHDDTLTGNDSANILSGNVGDDTLSSGGGNDRLIGGDGADAFRFQAGDGRDTIIDLELGTDHIVFVGRSFADLSFHNDGTNIEIAYTATDTVVLRGVGDVTFAETDFIFE